MLRAIADNLNVSFMRQEVRVGYLLREGLSKDCELQVVKIWRSPEGSAGGS